MLSVRSLNVLNRPTFLSAKNLIIIFGYIELCCNIQLSAANTKRVPASRLSGNSCTCAITSLASYMFLTDTAPCAWSARQALRRRTAVGIANISRAESATNAHRHLYQAKDYLAGNISPYHSANLCIMLLRSIAHHINLQVGVRCVNGYV